MKKLSTPWFLAGSEGAMAWTDSDRRTVWFWRVGMDEPRRIATVKRGLVAQFLTLGGDLLTWDSAAAAGFVADLRSGGVTELSKIHPYAHDGARGKGFYVTYLATQLKSPNPLQKLLALGTDDLPPLPDCTSKP